MVFERAKFASLEIVFNPFTARPIHSTALRSEAALRRSLNPKLTTASPSLGANGEIDLGADTSFSVVTIQQCQPGSDFNETNEAQRSPIPCRKRPWF